MSTRIYLVHTPSRTRVAVAKLFDDGTLCSVGTLTDLAAEFVAAVTAHYKRMDDTGVPIDDARRHYSLEIH